MKLTFKKQAFLLSLGLGLGLGLGLSASASAEVDPWCDVLAVKCSEGNQVACQTWTINCQIYGGE